MIDYKMKRTILDGEKDSPQYPADNPRQLGEFLAREEHAMDDVLLTYLDLDKLAGRYKLIHEPAKALVV
jgi:hypothetical protein